jgi:hypothetical protein
MFPRSDALATPSETSILHLEFGTAMTNTAVEPAASGSVHGNMFRHGNVSNQHLQISLARLNSSTTYRLAAFIGGDTNATNVTVFTTDSRGAFRFAYGKKAGGNPGSGEQPLPVVLDPLRNVLELDIVNSRTQSVLKADLTDPDQLAYLIMRSMDNTGIVPAALGTLRIQANQNATQFRLIASGLTPNTNYVLLINGSAAQTNSTDSAGSLKLTALPPNAPAVLDIHTVGLTDIAGNLVLTLGSGTGGVGIATEGQAGIDLRSASAFTVLAGSTVANTGSTSVDGDLGLSAGSAVVGFPPGIVSGTIHAADPTAAQAQLDLTTAFNDAAGRTVAPVSVAGNLGGQTLAPGLYKSTGSLEISSGDLTLDAKGDSNAVFIFQIATTLTTTAGRHVILSGGAKAANIFWQVGTSATLGTTTIFKGTIMADQSIALTTGASLEGRALARIGAVTLDSNVITFPVP